MSAMLFSTCGLSAEEADREIRQREIAHKKGIAVEGYDPVSYHQKDGPNEGRKTIKTTYQGITYYFATESNREIFEKSPESYEPLFGGWCAWAMLDGKQVDINPESYKLVDGKLMLFYDTIWADTLEKWNDAVADGQSEETLIKQAEEAWGQIIAPE